MNNNEVNLIDGILVRPRKKDDAMNLHSKTFIELNAQELQREIDYISGQYDYVSNCEYLPKDIKVKQADYLWKELDALTTRMLVVSMG